MDRERWTTRSGVRIRYLDNAPANPAGLPILFSPGVHDFADDYPATLAFFRPRRVLVVEVRGRGGSEAPESGYANADHARDLAAVVAEEGLTRFHLMTFSRGTISGLELALEHPSAIASVSIGDYPAEAVVFTDWFVDTLSAATWRGVPVPERIERRVMENIRADSRFRDYYPGLAALGVPVLVAKAERNGALRDGGVDRYRDTIPGLEMITIPGTGHDLFRPDRTAYPAAVAEFLARRLPGL